MIYEEVYSNSSTKHPQKIFNGYHVDQCFVPRCLNAVKYPNKEKAVATIFTLSHIA